jgi:hypothetical protein
MLSMCIPRLAIVLCHGFRSTSDQHDSEPDLFLYSDSSEFWFFCSTNFATLKFAQGRCKAHTEQSKGCLSSPTLHDRAEDACTWVDCPGDLDHNPRAGSVRKRPCTGRMERRRVSEQHASGNYHTVTSCAIIYACLRYLDAYVQCCRNCAGDLPAHKLPPYATQTT